MILKKLAGIAFILTTSCIFWIGYEHFALAEKEVSTVQEEPKQVYYELHSSPEGSSIPASVYVKGEKVITFTQTAGGLTPRARAKVLVEKLETFMVNNENPDKIFPAFQNGIAVGTYDDKILFTADVNSAKSAGLSVSELALAWTNNIRRAFGSVELLNDYNWLKLIADKMESAPEYRETGIASWYGGYFHGRTAADGSIYNMYKFTAAHKSLPFGSVVKVTNLENNSSCIVKITDRGPFIEGRIIDLSQVAAEEIGMLGPGTSPVEIEVLGRV